MARRVHRHLHSHRRNPGLADDALMLGVILVGGSFAIGQLTRSLAAPVQAAAGGVGGAAAATGQGVGGAVGTFGSGVGGALGSTGQGVGGAFGNLGQGIGGFFSGLGNWINPASRSVYQWHADGQCWFDTQDRFGNWSYSGPVDPSNCGG
jgi:hypothetical protein